MNCKERYLKHYEQLRYRLAWEVPKKLYKDDEFWHCIKHLNDVASFKITVNCMRRLFPDVPYGLLAKAISYDIMTSETILKDNKELAIHIWNNVIPELIDDDVEKFIRDEFKRKYDEANNKSWWKFW